jgi:hypothetical protein
MQQAYVKTMKEVEEPSYTSRTYFAGQDERLHHKIDD